MSEGRYVSFRVNGKDEDILETLMGNWGENQSQVVKRALQIAYDVECLIQEEGKEWADALNAAFEDELPES